MSVILRHDHARCGAGHHVHEHEHEHGAGGAARPFAFASSPRHFERDRPFAIEHIALDLQLDFTNKSLQGSAALTLKRVDPDAYVVELDAVGFAIDRVMVDDKAATYTYDGRRLSVELATDFERGVLSVAYAATPRKGLYFLEPD
jgi:aminopeptidase N